MPRIKPFNSLRPEPTRVEEVYIRHEDAGSPDRVRKLAKDNPLSLLNVSQADIIFPEYVDKDLNALKKIAADSLKYIVEQGALIRDSENYFYIYRLSMANHSQTGLVALVDVEDYIAGHIKNHELTRKEKVHIQEMQLEMVEGNIEPILLAYDSSTHPHKLIEDWAYSHDSIYDFYDEGGIHHEVWIISDSDLIDEISKAAMTMNAFYICDGHHRIAAAREYYESLDNPEDSSRYFMAAIFPSDEMLVLDYNRAVKDLAGLSADEFIEKLKESDFTVEEIGPSEIYPGESGEYAMVLEGKWYLINYRGERKPNSPVDDLDVSLLQEKVLNGILKIEDPRHDPRLSFISGIKGLDAVKRASEAGLKDGEVGVGFALNPSSMEEIIEVSDAGLTMPPKSTWFEPKLAGGLLIYKFY